MCEKGKKKEIEIVHQLALIYKVFVMENVLLKLVLLQLLHHHHHQICAITPGGVQANQPVSSTARQGQSHVMKSLDFQKRVIAKNKVQLLKDEDLQPLLHHENGFNKQHRVPHSNSTFHNVKNLTRYNYVNENDLNHFMTKLDNKIKSILENRRISVSTNDDHTHFPLNTTTDNQNDLNNNVLQSRDFNIEERENVTYNKILNEPIGFHNSQKILSLGHNEVKMDGVNQLSEYLQSRKMPYTISESIKSNINEKIDINNHLRKKQQNISGEIDLKNEKLNSYQNRMGTFWNDNVNLDSTGRTYTQNRYNPESFTYNDDDNFKVSSRAPLRSGIASERTYTQNRYNPESFTHNDDDNFDDLLQRSKNRYNPESFNYNYDNNFDELLQRSKNRYNPESFTYNDDDNFDDLLQRLKTTIRREPSLREYMKNLIDNALSYTSTKNVESREDPFEHFSGNRESQNHDTDIKQVVSLIQLHHQVDQKQYPGIKNTNPSLQELFRQQSVDPATQFGKLSPAQNHRDMNMNFYQILEDMKPIQSISQNPSFFPYQNVQRPINDNNFVNPIPSTVQRPQNIPFDHYQPYVPAIHNPSEDINRPYYKPGIQSSFQSGNPSSQDETLINSPIVPSLATINPVPATVTTSNVQSCLKQTWCALAIATAFSITATGALAVPFVAPIFFGRRRREINYFVLNQDNIISFINKFIKYSEGEKMELTSMEEMFYDSVSKEHEESRKKFFQMLKSFILTNKYNILNVTIGEIQQMENKIIPKEIVDMILNEKIKEGFNLEDKIDFQASSELLYDFPHDKTSDKQNISSILKEQHRDNNNQLEFNFASVGIETTENSSMTIHYGDDDENQQQNVTALSVLNNLLDLTTAKNIHITDLSETSNTEPSSDMMNHTESSNTEPSSDMMNHTESSYQTTINNLFTEMMDELNRNNKTDFPGSNADTTAFITDQDAIVKVNNNPTFHQAFKYLNLEYANTVSFPSENVLDDSYSLPGTQNHPLPVEHKSHQYNGGYSYHHNQHPSIQNHPLPAEHKSNQYTSGYGHHHNQYPIDPLMQYQPPGSLIQYLPYRERTPQPYYTPSSTQISQSYHPVPENYYHQQQSNPFLRRNRIQNIPNENYLQSYLHQQNLPIRENINNQNSYSYKQVQASVPYNINKVSSTMNNNPHSNFNWPHTTTRMPDQYWKHTVSNTAGPILLQSDVTQTPPQFPKENLRFFFSVCSVIQHGDVPVNEITIFIAEKCILLRYAGVI